MLQQPYHLYIERKDANRNVARFYALEVSASLFGDTCLTRRWGRIGTRGQVRIEHFAHEQAAVDTFLHLLKEKRSRGYRTRSPAV
ncbi:MULTISPECIES: WGR domain-containing protein [unclassified Rhizobium]|uniref:WGR domain-containing protein n=1 Tax=unclassified Rhizobium TaxID=2613769 RepID=UPI001614E924|nr:MULTISPECIES: WGR domain-containing protein [unclassified Rhizobium]